MAKEKAVTKKDIEQLLNGQTKAILNIVDKKIDGQTKTILSAVDKKIDNKIDGLAVLIERSFQSNQEYMDTRFNAIGEDLGHMHYKLDKIDKKLDGQEKTIFNHDQRIDKLEIDLKLKKA
jgi:hypothetical protein